MTTDVLQRSTAGALDDVGGMRDALTVHRVFGDPYEFEGLTVIPVGRVVGGGGGGAGEADGQTGFGTGFGLGATAVGVYEVRDGAVTWRPVIDATRLAQAAIGLAALIVLCRTRVLLRRSR